MDLSYQHKRLADFGAGLKLSRALAERERWPRERLEQFQQERLNALVRHAAVNSPYYRKRLGPIAGDVQLSALPTIDKAALMDHFDEVVTDRRLRRDDLLARAQSLTDDALDLGRYRVMATSGSSGRKGLFVYDRPAWRELLAQFFRYNEMVGIRPRLPRLRVAAIGGASGAHMTRRITQTVSIGLHRVISLPVTLPLPQIVEALNRFQPQFMNVFPSIGVLLAEEQIAGRLRISLERMSTSSELRTLPMTERIEEAFGVKPFDLYGTTEGLWGSECGAHDGIHLFEDSVLVEDAGDRLYVTNLFNYTQPLIRFELSDSVTLDPEPCACGRTLVRMRSIRGRADDVLELGGVMVHPMQFAAVARDPEVVEFQVVDEEQALRLLVVPRGEAPELEPRLQAMVERRLAELGVDEPCVVVERCAGLARGPGGKLQIVVARSYAPAREDRRGALQGTDASRA